MDDEGEVLIINDRAEHDAAVTKADDGTPTVLFVCNSSTPPCKAFVPKYAEMAAKYADRGVKFYRMEFNSETSYLFKFSPNQLPVLTVMINGRWARTVMGGDAKGLESAIGELLLQPRK